MKYSKSFLFGLGVLVLAAVMLSLPSMAMEGHEEHHSSSSAPLRQVPKDEIPEALPAPTSARSSQPPAQGVTGSLSPNPKLS